MYAATTEIYTLSLHDALPIFGASAVTSAGLRSSQCSHCAGSASDRKSTRLNSSHRTISYAVFCLKKKKILSQVSRPKLPLRNRRRVVSCFVALQIDVNIAYFE